MRPETEALLLLLQNEVSGAEQRKVQALLDLNLDWRFFTRLTIFHKVCAIVYKNLQRYRVAKYNIELIKQEAAAEQQKSLMLIAELTKIQRILNKASVPFAFVKGPAAAVSMYRNFQERTFYDLDLFVRKQDVVIVDGLLTDFGYHIETKMSPKMTLPLLMSLDHEVGYVGRNPMLHIDLHWQPLNCEYLFPLSMEQLFEHLYNQPLGNSSIQTLAPELHFIFICMHAAKHRWMRWFWIMDIANAIKNSSPDWNAVAEMSVKLRLANIVRISIHLANIVLRSPLPDQPLLAAELEPGLRREITEVINSFERCTTEEEPWKYWRSIPRLWRIRDSKIDAIRCIGNMFFRPWYADWKVLKLPQNLFFCNYIIRALRLLARPTIRLIRRFVKNWRFSQNV